MKRISSDQHVYAMSPDNPPVLRISPGEQIQFETLDALAGQVKRLEDFNGLDMTRVNPATGPVYVEGAEVGDILSVRIDKIEVDSQGLALCGKGMGVLGNVLEDSARKIIPIADGYAHFSEKIRIPLNKMIGVIGTAPKDESIPCGAPDYHGGNMDCKEVREGATVLLPVNVSGGLLAMGDLHAAMADGEVSITGVEVGGCVTATIDLIKGKNWPLPMISNDSHIMTLASHVDLDIAVEMAVANMVGYLEHEEKFDKYEAVMLCSLVADVQICQVVDPKKTIRVTFPKMYLEAAK